MLAELGMDPREHAMPGDFYAAHGELATRIQHVKQRDKDKRIADRIRKGELDAYFFGALGLTLRPLFSGAEVVQEGTRQNHCVGQLCGPVRRRRMRAVRAARGQRPGHPSLHGGVWKRRAAEAMPRIQKRQDGRGQGTQEGRRAKARAVLAAV